MKRILGLALISALFSLFPLAARNSHVFLLPSDVRVGDAQLPQGHIDVTWTDTSGSLVQLTIKTQDKKTTTVPARMIEEAHPDFAVGTEEVNGVRYLRQLFTTKVLKVDPIVKTNFGRQ